MIGFSKRTLAYGCATARVPQALLILGHHPPSAAGDAR
jgi:hypothetical protein